MLPRLRTHVASKAACAKKFFPLILSSFLLSSCYIDVPTIDYSAAHLENSRNEFDQALYESYKLDDDVLYNTLPTISARAFLEKRFPHDQTPDEIREYLNSIGADCEIKESSNFCQYSQYIEIYSKNFFRGYIFEDTFNFYFFVEFSNEIEKCCKLNISSKML